MSSVDISPRDALTRLGASTAEAVAQVLETLVPEQIERGDVTVAADGSSPFAGARFPAVAAGGAYADGTGAIAFLMNAQSARRLAAALSDGSPGEQGEIERPSQLGEHELSAIAEAASQMMGAAGNALSLVLGQEIEISAPQANVLESAAAAEGLYGAASHATSTTFMIGGHPCQLVQLVPQALVSRIAAAAKGEDGEAHEVELVDALREIKLRVWAEIGRTRLPLGRTLEIPPGSVTELDHAADDPVDVYVNGLLFGRGSLLTTDDGDWAIRLQSLETSQTKVKAMVRAHLSAQ